MCIYDVFIYVLSLSFTQYSGPYNAKFNVYVFLLAYDIDVLLVLLPRMVYNRVFIIFLSYIDTECPLWKKNDEYERLKQTIWSIYSLCRVKYEHFGSKYRQTCFLNFTMQKEVFRDSLYDSSGWHMENGHRSWFCHKIFSNLPCSNKLFSLFRTLALSLSLSLSVHLTFII